MNTAATDRQTVEQQIVKLLSKDELTDTDRQRLTALCGDPVMVVGSPFGGGPFRPDWRALRDRVEQMRRDRAVIEAADPGKVDQTTAAVNEQIRKARKQIEQLQADIADLERAKQAANNTLGQVGEALGRFEYPVAGDFGHLIWGALGWTMQDRELLRTKIYDLNRRLWS